MLRITSMLLILALTGATARPAWAALVTSLSQERLVSVSVVDFTTDPWETHLLASDTSTEIGIFDGLLT